MTKAVFNSDGTFLTVSKGRVWTHYRKGDKVEIIGEMPSGKVKVKLLQGEGKGLTIDVDKFFLEIE
jgi:hypothetical protein